MWPEAALRGMRAAGGLAEALASVKARGLLATAKGDGKPYDFVSRFFAPGMGVHEDPVTGSANCALTRFWSKRLAKKQLRVWQASPRGGDLLCTDEGDRVTCGTVRALLAGEIKSERSTRRCSRPGGRKDIERGDSSRATAYEADRT